MALSGLIGIIGLMLVLPSLYQLNPIMMFYMGRRRDLYFSTELRMMMIVRNNTSTLIVGVAILAALFVRPFGLWALLFGVGLVAALMIASSNTALVPFKPNWLREFEANHHPLDIDLVKARGRWLMENYPNHFPKLIDSAEGWETWLLTVI